MIYPSALRSLAASIYPATQYVPITSCGKHVAVPQPWHPLSRECTWEVLCDASVWGLAVWADGRWRRFLRFGTPVITRHGETVTVPLMSIV